MMNANSIFFERPDFLLELKNHSILVPTDWLWRKYYLPSFDSNPFLLKKSSRVPSFKIYWNLIKRLLKQIPSYHQVKNSLTKTQPGTIYFVNQGSISPWCLRAAYALANPSSAKRQSSHQCLFALLGYANVKAARA